MKTITLKAKAKINLFLEITGKRENGYHDISTVMHEIDLCDDITLSKNDTGTVTITSNSATMPLDERNIAYKCAAAFFDEINEENTGLNIDIQKHIPMEAGLAGGSTDGAAVLNGLNELYNNILSKEKLCEIGKRVGADLPFCIMGGAMLCEGIGEIMTPCPVLPECVILVAKGKEGVSTKEAYANIDATPSREIKENKMPSLLEKGDLKEICRAMYNCFEYLVPSVEPIKEIMNKYGALNSMMSGSGSAVFGIFEDKQKAENALNELKDKEIFAAIC
ncbi:MAG: 4-(cytidine 5'-diphospho)-2-C-methyl-D-erythritol kinase [Ruminococcaceae bacterium]|nr:4-(cytidine 5'-diphospho)-2-C-methyl-D-erythritol kinase [Oscillospiraceae bacterium]